MKHLIKNENGSVFVFILIGIALFAALSYAVTQSIRVSGDSEGITTGRADRNSLVIVDLQQFLEAVSMRVTQLTQINSVPEGQLDFRNDIYRTGLNVLLSNNINSTCITSNCRIFSPYAPDGIIPVVIREAASTDDQPAKTLPQNGHATVRQIRIDSVGSSAPELVFIIHAISPQICNLYNAKNGITTNYNSTTTMVSISETSPGSVPENFSGSFNSTRSFGSGATIFKGKKTFCAPAYLDGLSNRLGIWKVVKIR